MTVPIADCGITPIDALTSVRWWNQAAHCELVLATPSAEPTLWDEFVAGAVRSYRKHGVVDAIEPSTLADPAVTSLFLAAVDDGVQRPALSPSGGHRDDDEQPRGPQRYDQFLYSFQPNFLAI